MNVKFAAGVKNISDQDNLGVWVAESTLNVGTVLSGHHKDNVVAVEVGATGELRRGAAAHDASAVQRLSRSRVHLLTHVPVCRPGTRHDNAPSQNLVGLDEFLEDDLTEWGAADVAGADHGYAQNVSHFFTFVSGNFTAL